jgi:hypothetical protein
VDSKPSEILSKSGFIPYSGPSSGGTSSFYRSPTQPNGLSNSDDSEYIEYFPTSLAVRCINLHYGLANLILRAGVSSRQCHQRVSS